MVLDLMALWVMLVLVLVLRNRGLSCTLAVRMGIYYIGEAIEGPAPHERYHTYMGVKVSWQE